METDITQQCVDRISNLPPELIGKILSLLPTKEAVATCVLSSRWKWCWTSITRLKLANSAADLQKPSFISFVYRLLRYCKPQALDYFSICWYTMENITHFRAWVSATLLVDIKELDLTMKVGYDASHVLPFELFSCKKLVKLTLTGDFRMDNLTLTRDFRIDVPASVCLPSLEVLRLNWVRFVDDDSIKRLLIGCPALAELNILNSNVHKRRVLPQELFSSKTLAKLKLSHNLLIYVPTLVSLPSIKAMHLVGITFRDDDSVERLLCGCPSLQELELVLLFDVLHIDSPTLSNLTVVWGLASGGDHVAFQHKIVLKTPSLRYLKVVGVSLDSCVLTELNQLVEADIRCMHVDEQSQASAELMMGIADVRRLYLSVYVMEVIAKSGCQLPKFHNLTFLKLGVSGDVGWAVLPDLLEKSPFLEMLVFDECPKADPSSLKNATWHAPQEVPYCLIHHLKVIQVNYFEGDVEEEEMIRYFIDNGGALKDLTIQYSKPKLGYSKSKP